MRDAFFTDPWRLASRVLAVGLTAFMLAFGLGTATPDAPAGASTCDPVTITVNSDEISESHRGEWLAIHREGAAQNVLDEIEIRWRAVGTQSWLGSIPLSKWVWTSIGGNDDWWVEAKGLSPATEYEFHWTRLQGNWCDGGPVLAWTANADGSPYVPTPTTQPPATIVPEPPPPSNDEPPETVQPEPPDTDPEVEAPDPNEGVCAFWVGEADRLDGELAAAKASNVALEAEVRELTRQLAAAQPGGVSGGGGGNIEPEIDWEQQAADALAELRRVEQQRDDLADAEEDRRQTAEELRQAKDDNAELLARIAELLAKIDVLNERLDALTPATDPPATPTGLTATPVEVRGNLIDLAWDDPVDEVAGWVVYARPLKRLTTSTHPEWTTERTTLAAVERLGADARGTQFNAAGLGKAFAFRVAAVGEGGESDQSWPAGAKRNARGVWR